MRIGHALAYALPAFLLAGAAVAGEPDQVPVVGKEGPEADACVAVGRVSGLNPLGENYLSVREKPGRGGREKDRLGPSTLVWLCDASEDWQGVVYPSGPYQDLGDCQVSTPMQVPEPYVGPCRSGWVHGHFIELVAG